MSAIVLRGDAAHLPLPDASVDLICTSPPYFGLRSYSDGGEAYDGQIGSEETPAEYIAALLACTREWMRVLKPEGSMFVNLGDVYYSAKGNPGPNSADPKQRARRGWERQLDQAGLGFPRKSLLFLPERYRIACLDGLGLTGRSVIIWHKTNPLPDSAQDRTGRAHEDIVHLVKRPVYYSACDEIRLPRTAPERNHGAAAMRGRNVNIARTGTGDYAGPNPLGKIPGSVWSVATSPLPAPDRLGVDHFAAWPMALVRPIVLGWSPPGICVMCGQGRRPVVDRKPMEWRESPTLNGRRGGRSFRPASGTMLAPAETRITGYACACPDASAPTRPAVVVDPFGGTGTTALVADVLGRTGITVDRSADYCRLAQWRTTDPCERARAMQVPKPPPVPQGQASLFDEAI